jgi:hypothetical protein
MTTDEIKEFLSRTATPNGYMYTLVLASHTKRILQTKLPEEWRFLFLNHLEKMVDTWLTPEMIAALEPMDQRGEEMLAEIAKVGPKKALDLYAKAFVAFAALNPSLIGVLKMSPAYRYRLEREAGATA